MKKRGRPNILQNPTRVIVQLESVKYEELLKKIDISVSQFFRNCVDKELKKP